MNKYVLATLFLFFSSFVYSNESELTITQQLERLQREVSDLSKEVFSNPTNLSNGTNNDFVKNLSAIDLRIYEIENDIKNLPKADEKRTPPQRADPYLPRSCGDVFFSRKPSLSK